MTQPPQPRHSFFTPSFLPSFALIPTQIWWTMSSPQAEEAEEVVASQSEQARSRLRTIVTVLSLLFFSTLLLSSPVSPILLRSTLQLHTFPSAITLSSAKVAQSLNQSFILWDEPAASIDVRVIRHAIGYPLKATVIFAHGLSQNAWSTNLVFALSARLPGIRWVLMQANLKDVSVYNTTIPAWYDIATLPHLRTIPDIDPEGMIESTQQMNAVIRAEQLELVQSRTAEYQSRDRSVEEQAYSYVAGTRTAEEKALTKAERKFVAKSIILAGFSQGSIITQLASLTSEVEVAGIVVMSGYLPEMLTANNSSRAIFEMYDKQNRKQIPLFWGHGTGDSIIPYSEALTSIRDLKLQGHDTILFRSYPGLNHMDLPQEWSDLGDWLDAVLQ